MDKPQQSNYYRTLIREYNKLEAIPVDKRTRFDKQNLIRLKRSIDEAETRMALAEVRG